MRNQFTKLKAVLSATKTQTSNNPLFQTINGLINTSQETTDGIQQAVNAVQEAIDNFETIKIVDIDVSGGPATILLSDFVTGIVVIKDVTGNAGANNITMTGVVEGITDPVINTDFGVFRIYLSSFDGAFHTW